MRIKLSNISRFGSEQSPLPGNPHPLDPLLPCAGDGDFLLGDTPSPPTEGTEVPSALPLILVTLRLMPMGRVFSNAIRSQYVVLIHPILSQDVGV